MKNTSANTNSTTPKSDKSKSKSTTTKSPQPFLNDLDYLQSELEWMEVRAWRITADHTLRRDANEDPDRAKLPRAWREEEPDLKELTKRAKRLAKREQKLRTTIDKRLQIHHKAVGPTALDTLCETFHLNNFERLVLLMTSALAFSRGFEETFNSMIPNQHTAPTAIENCFNFAELPFSERISHRSFFSKTANLVSNDLVIVDIGYRLTGPHDVLTAQVNITNQAFAFLVSQPDLMNEFIEFSSLEEPNATVDQVVLADTEKQRILSVVSRHDEYLQKRAEWGFDDIITYGRGALMLFYGAPGTGKTMMAHAVAHSMGKRVLNVDLPTFVNHSEAQRFLPGLFREARLQNAVLFFDECESIFADRRGGNPLMTILLTEIERFEGIAILATNLPETLDAALDRRILVKVHFPAPDREARLNIWKKHIPPAAPMADDIDLPSLAARFELTGGYIKNVMLIAVADAVHQNNDTLQITMDMLERAARDQLRRPTDDNSGLIHPDVRLEHIILSPKTFDQIEELIDAARDRNLVLEKWGIGQHMSYGKGTSALFYGPPGTGKTICAEAIAGELNRPLLTASMPAIQSKYVGQAERNLENLFKHAADTGAVLFLDEADTLLTERGTGHASRHDDSIVNALLTNIERHDGLVLLATNRAAALDSALERRITYRLEFTMPTPELRTQIWQKLLPDTVPTEGTIDFQRLGQRFALSGGLIKNAVFKTAFRAARHNQPVTQTLLEACAREELGTDTKASIGFAQ